MTDEEIIGVVKYWLEHDDKRAARAAIGQRYFLEKFGSRQYVQDVSNHIRQVQNGARGFSFPYAFAPLPNPLPMDG